MQGAAARQVNAGAASDQSAEQLVNPTLSRSLLTHAIRADQGPAAGDNVSTGLTHT